MSKNAKKGLVIAGLSVDGAITVFLFVISIILIIESSKHSNLLEIELDKKLSPFIKYLMLNPTVYFVAFVIPLFVLLAINIVALVIYLKKPEKKVSVSDLSEDQKEALKKQIMDELSKK